MPFDPNLPIDGSLVDATELRAQFNALKTLIDALQTQITALNATVVALANIVPVGTILHWCKNSFGVALVLPDNFMECNGQVVNDPESPLNGETLPNPNGEGQFLRGAALSGDSGGAETHTHDVDLSGSSAGDPGASGGSTVPWGTYATSADSSLPPYYEVVLVMRVK
jgi:hypothetical protein